MVLDGEGYDRLTDWWMGYLKTIFHYHTRRKGYSEYEEIMWNEAGVACLSVSETSRETGGNIVVSAQQQPPSRYKPDTSRSRREFLQSYNQRLDAQAMPTSFFLLLAVWLALLALSSWHSPPYFKDTFYLIY